MGWIGGSSCCCRKIQEAADRERRFAGKQQRRKPGRAERNEPGRSGHLRLPGKLAWRIFHWLTLAIGCPCAAVLPPIPEVAPEWSQRTCRGLVQQLPARRVLSNVLWFRRSRFYLQTELFFRLTTTQLDVSKRYLRRLMNTKLSSLYSNCGAKPSCLSQSHSGRIFGHRHSIKVRPKPQGKVCYRLAFVARCVPDPLYFVALETLACLIHES